MSKQEICRLCAELKADLISIHDNEGLKFDLSAKIKKHLDIEVNITDGLSQLVCIDCCVLLNQCSDFYKQSNKAQDSLRQSLIGLKDNNNHFPHQSVNLIDSSTVSKYEKKEKIPFQNKVTEETEKELSSQQNVSHTVVNKNNESSNYSNINSDDGKLIKCEKIKLNLDIELEKTSEKNVEQKRKVTKNNIKKIVSSSCTEVKNQGKEKNIYLKEDITDHNYDGINHDYDDLDDDDDNDDDIGDNDGDSYVKDKRLIKRKPNVKIPDDYMAGTEFTGRELSASGSSDSCGISDIKINELNSKSIKKQQEKETISLEKYPWLCTDCNDKLSSLEMLEKHHKIVHNQQPKYMCVQCCKVYEKYYGFLTHIKRHKIKSKYNCDECGKSFTHKKVLESHRSVHSEDRPYVCQTCNKSFRQQSALYIHSRCHLPDTMKNRYPCDQCDKRFSTKPNLVTHKRIHSGVRNFTCDQCGKSFIQKGNLEAHFLTHSKDKPYVCTQCPKAFKTPLQLKKHETVHTGAKPHQCTICGRTFREKGTLREHHRIHTGAMPFTCEFCGKSFRFKGILTTHRRQHTGERPYSCLECQHHFTNWPNYNKHMKRRHGINTSHTKHLRQPNNKNNINNNNNSSNSNNNNNNESENNSESSLQHDDINQIDDKKTTALTFQTTPAQQNIISTVVPNSMIQVIQTVSRHNSSPQPIIVQAVPSTAYQANLTTKENITTTNNSTVTTTTANTTNTTTATVFKDKDGRTYFNGVSATLETFIPTHLPYNV
ncbi:GSCOCG00006602001-RA-CDS [Cotesia congregata]|nr:GSCOCG00006602001-RA-CDS [Cotesia congregata]